MPVQHVFGGDWTTEKLNCVASYLQAYSSALKNQQFETVYIDAFAGTGYRSLARADRCYSPFVQQLLGSPLEGNGVRRLDGSARLALKTSPPFSRYVFIEKNKRRFAALTRLKEDFPSLADRIELRNSDANSEIDALCHERWTRQRAVMFLDPYGLQVPMTTIKKVAATRAIDTWMLLPVSAVIRLLPKNGAIGETNLRVLDAHLGGREWYQRFYSVETERTLFGDRERLVKIADPSLIETFYLEKLRKYFAGIADKPLWLRNSKSCPLFLLCFGVGNPHPKAKTLAIRLAEAVLK